MPAANVTFNQVKKQNKTNTSAICKSPMWADYICTYILYCVLIYTCMYIFRNTSYHNKTEKH